MPPLIFAHRGASGLFPENTMEAFHAAVRRKADGIELDAQLSRDNKVVVIHDHRLDRTTTGSGLVRQHTWKQLRQLRADKSMHPRFDRARIPALREVFQTFFDSPLRFIIELKNFLSLQPNLEELVVEQVRRFGLTERTVLSSFNYESLLRIKKLDPAQTTALLYIGPLERPWEVAARYQADQLHVPEEELTPQLVMEAHQHGFPVYGWTVNSERKMREALRIGVDGLITNYPGRARKLLRLRR